MSPTDRKSLVYKGVPPDSMCGDTTLRVLPDGDWGAFFVTGGATEPHLSNYIVMCRSADRGETWSEPWTVLRYHYKACLFSEVVVDSGRITMYAQTHGGMFDHWRVVTLFSDDGGTTWSRPEPFAPLPHRAFVRNRYVSSWGHWYLPFQAYVDSSGWFASPMEDDGGHKARIGVLISTDEGRSWETSESVGPLAGWAENNVVELSDGTLTMLARSDGTGRLFETRSHDRGQTWSDPAPTGIPNPGSKFRLHRLSDSRIVLVHNPSERTEHPNSKVQAYVNRNPLSLWVSDDDMRTWGYRRDLTDFPGMLAYPDGFVTDDESELHLVFDYNRQSVIYWGAELPRHGAVRAEAPTA